MFVSIGLKIKISALQSAQEKGACLFTLPSSAVVHPGHARVFPVTRDINKRHAAGVRVCVLG